MKQLHNLLQFKKFDRYTVVGPDSNFRDWQFDISMWFTEEYHKATITFYANQTGIFERYFIVPWNFKRPIQMFYGG